ncbi:ornithine cyclodeaminase family protein [Streptomyces sp. NBC_00316]|uniref:ornithine cyclodeaminase family protein n=1 Tax=Streptomyces sp. NBC_00316 TaxID=2975710 RepID=UPI002E2A9278|nr:NAD(P)-binding domain-containing protein [Streptomyces sp. NBC_00316]
MSGVLVLDAAQTRASLDPERLAEALTVALVAIARGTASAPPRVAAQAPAGLLGVMPAHVPGLGLAAKLVSVFADPANTGRSSHRGVVALFDEQDGRPLAVMDAESVTAVRTAATATLAMRALAPPGAARIAVLGTGVQATEQLGLLARQDPTTPVVVGGRDPGRARALAARHPQATADSIEGAVRGSDVVLCCTGAREPVLCRAWLAEGAHVGSVGGSHGPELDPETVRDGSLFVEWTGAVTSPPPAGAHELQGRPPERATMLGTILDGSHPGRRHPGELTVFKSTGHAALDVAAAAVVYASAREQHLGTHLAL